MQAHSFHEYIGQIKALNQHLVAGSYWEWVDYTLYDMTTGKMIFNKPLSYPNLSPNEYYILTLNANPYDMTGELPVSKVKDGQITPTFSTAFKYWMPSYKKSDMFLVFRWLFLFSDQSR